MGRYAVHRSEAARLTRMAQGGAVVMLGGAFAAYALLPVAERVAPVAAPGGEGPAEAEGPAGPAMDFQKAAEALALLGDKAPEAPAEDRTAPDKPADEGQAGEAWKYLGAIVEPGRRVAIVSAGGKQHLVGPGATLDGIRVVDVLAEGLVVAENGAERTIALEKKEGVVLGAVQSAGPGAGEGTEYREADPEAGGARPLDRRGVGPTRPGVPGAKGVPRPPRPRPGASVIPQQPRAPTPEGGD